MPSTRPSALLIGIDQQWLRLQLAANSRTGVHLGSVERSSLMTSSPDHAAEPQLPMLGPITTPSMASSQCGGNDGPAPGCSVLDSRSNSTTQAMTDGSYSSMPSTSSESTSRSGASRAIRS